LRLVRFAIPTDTSLFTPLQLQPRCMFWLGMSAWARWLQEHLVSFRHLIRDHRLGFVVLSAHLEYLQPFGFFDADELVVEAGFRARMGGVVLQGDYNYIGGGKKVAEARCILRPVRLQDLHSLAAVPSRLSPSLLDRFQPDEVDRERPERVVPELVRELEKGQALAEASSPLMIHRHDCEVADQWSFIEVPSHVGAARERLALEHAGDSRALSSALSNPLRSIDAELNRPMYLLDQGTTSTKAYSNGGEVGFIHRLYTGVQEHAVVVERFVTSAIGGEGWGGTALPSPDVD